MRFPPPFDPLTKTNLDRYSESPPMLEEFILWPEKHAKVWDEHCQLVQNEIDRFKKYEDYFKAMDFCDQSMVDAREINGSFGILNLYWNICLEKPFGAFGLGHNPALKIVVSWYRKLSFKDQALVLLPPASP